MESDEKYIESRFGKKVPFTVPEGYFDNLAKSIVDNVASAPVPDDVEPTVNINNNAEPVSVAMNAEQAKTVGFNWWHRYRVRIAAAACVAFVVAGMSMYFAFSPTDANGNKNVAIHGGSTVESSASSSTSDMEIDYAMLDNDDIYSLMASN